MKNLIIIFVFLLGSNIAFADSGAKLYLKNGSHIMDQTIDAAGFKHGIELNVPGTAYISRVIVKNAGTSFLSSDGAHGDGRGIVANGPRAHIIIFDTHSKDNTEDGFRAINGGTLTIVNSKASGNKRVGFLAGKGSTVILSNSESFKNKYGLMGAEAIKIVVHGGKFYENIAEGMQFVQGGTVEISGAVIHGNNTAKKKHEDYGGISIFGTPVVAIKTTSIQGNFETGINSDSDISFTDADVRVTLDRVTISNNGTVAIKSRGNSIVQVTNSSLEGECLEERDATGGTMGIITVNGQGVVSGPCPAN